MTEEEEKYEALELLTDKIIRMARLAEERVAVPAPYPRFNTTPSTAIATYWDTPTYVKYEHRPRVDHEIKSLIDDAYRLVSAVHQGTGSRIAQEILMDARHEATQIIALAKFSANEMQKRVGKEIKLAKQATDARAAQLDVEVEAKAKELVSRMYGRAGTIRRTRRRALAADCTPVHEKGVDKETEAVLWPG